MTFAPDSHRHDPMVSLVEQMRELHKRLHAANAAADRPFLLIAPKSKGSENHRPFRPN